MGRKSDAGGRILEASTSLFWRKGFEAVGTDEICREAGVNKGTLYHFYGNKKELALAVIQGHARLADDLIESELGGKKPEEKIIHYLGVVRNFQKEKARELGKVLGCPCGNLSAEMAGKDDKITAAVADWFRSIMAFIAGNLREVNRGLSPRKAAGEARDIFTRWQGALLMAKTMNDASHLDLALRNINGTIKRIKAGA